MEKFNFVEIYQYRVDLKISCTDHFVLDNIVDEIKKKFQKIHVNEQTRKMPTGEKYQYTLSSTSSGLEDVFWWMVREFCRQGWEPVHSLKKMETTLNYCSLKKKD